MTAEFPKTEKRIYRSAGTEGTCPICGGGNAMLDARYWDDEADKPVEALECRDCGHLVVEPDVVEVSYDELITIKY